MSETNGYSRDGDTVTLRMTADDYNSLLFCMGLASGAASNADMELNNFIRLFNRLNTGNPAWTPYEEETKS